MKTGLITSKNDVRGLAQKVMEQAKLKKDYVARAEILSVDKDGNFIMPEIGAFPMTDLFETQTATFLGYPHDFYRRSQAAHPDEWMNLVNAMFKAHIGETRMVRTLGTDARAFLSNKYRAIDNDMIAENILSAVDKMHGEWEVVSADITDHRMYIKVLTPRTAVIPGVGDVVRSGFVASTSEVGLGSLAIEGFMQILRCLNGMISDMSMKRRHIGGRITDDMDIFELMKDDTRRITDAALMYQMRDMLAATVSEVEFGKRVEKIAASTEQKITGDVPKVIEVTAKKFGLTDNEGSSILAHYASQGLGNSQYSLSNAITAAAQDDAIDYDRAVQLEKVGYQVVTLPASEWKVISEAKN